MIILTRNLSTGISFGYKVTPNFSLGVTGKYLYEKIYVDEASGLAFDFGTNYWKGLWNLALVISNVGSMSELEKMYLLSFLHLFGSEEVQIPN